MYTCYGGAHSSPVAAALHLGRLPMAMKPTPAQVMAWPLFDAATPQDRGRLVYAGTDGHGRAVYVFGRGRAGLEAVYRALRRGFGDGKPVGGETDRGLPQGLRVWVVDTLPTVNAAMRIGGYTSRRLGIVRAGRPVAAWGTVRAYGHLVRLVRKTKALLHHMDRLHSVGIPLRIDPVGCGGWDV